MRTFIFGAGASRGSSYCLPTTEDFFKESPLFPEDKSKEDEWGHLKGFIEKEFEPDFNFLEWERLLAEGGYDEAIEKFPFPKYGEEESLRQI